MNIFPLETKHLLVKPVNEAEPLQDRLLVTLKEGDKEIAYIKCDGELIHGFVGYELNMYPEYYAEERYYEEIFGVMAKFFMAVNEVMEVSCYCRFDDDHRKRGLEKAGYIRREFKGDSYRYSVYRQKTGWTGLYMIIGLTVGFVLGIILSNLWMGTAIGVLMGTVIGLLMDHRKQ